MILKNILIVSLSILLFSRTEILSSQIKYIKESGTITFFSSAPVEDIKAETTQFKSEVDLTSGSVSFTVPITGFVFKKSLMQKHFNEQYMESGKFPFAFFNGRFDVPGPILISAGSNEKIRVTGSLTIKGTTKQINEDVVLAVAGDGFTGKCIFKIRLADFGIRIPRMFLKNIAEQVEVSIDVKYKKE